jgi:hypothetical protein
VMHAPPYACVFVLCRQRGALDGLQTAEASLKAKLKRKGQAVGLLCQVMRWT